MEPITTIEQAEAAERAARKRFEESTVAFDANGKSVTMAEARAVFEKYHPGDDWKRPVDAIVDIADLIVFMQAVRFYHSCPADHVRCIRGSKGFRVTGPGYVC